MDSNYKGVIQMKKRFLLIFACILIMFATQAAASMIIKTSTEDCIFNNAISDQWQEASAVNFTFYEVSPFNVWNFEKRSWSNSWQGGVTAETPNFFNIGFSYTVSAGYLVEVQTVTNLDIPDIVTADYWVMDSYFKLETVFWYYNFASGENVTTKRSWTSKSLAVFNPVFQDNPVPLPESFCLFSGGLVLLGVRKYKSG
jgi:hypothetical protein